MKFFPDNALVLLTCLAVLAVCILIFVIVFKIAFKIRSLKVKLAAMFFLALYILSPIDLIPDVIPIIGQMDDAGALTAFIGLAISIYRDFKKKKKNTLK
jgi:uncharacterized membrane protein YkvA (DUF1232 family)